MVLSRLRIGAKLGLAFASVVLLTVVLGAVAQWQMKEINDDTDNIARNFLPSVQVLGDIRSTANRLRASELGMVLSPDATERTRLVKNTQMVAGLLLEHERKYAPLVTPAEAPGFEEFQRQRAAYLREQERLIALAGQGDAGLAQAAALLYRDSEKAFVGMAEASGKLSKVNSKAADEAFAESQATYRGARALMLGVLALAIVVAIVLGVTITRLITRPVAQAVLAARAMAQGDLTSAIDVRSRDEIGELSQALVDMQTQLSGVVAGVRRNADGVATASSEIAQGNHDLSARTESQASALEQTAASMEQMTATVRQNADNAQQANQLARSASTVAEQGGAVVGEVVQTMRGISAASHKIADIITVIDGIAFQTNILALNAAVEAARAGEQGRGFAVVAGEVRTLAQRSAEAAKEIKALITDSAQRVELGTQQVDRAGATMDEVVSSIRRVTDIMGEISAASREQSQGVAQVGEAVTQMDQATQQNAALVEEMAAAASSLQGQAQQLVQAVAVFRTRPGAGGASLALPG